MLVLNPCLMRLIFFKFPDALTCSLMWKGEIDTRIDICCSSKPGLLLSTVNTLEVLGLEIQQCVISCFNDFSLQASCSEVSFCFFPHFKEILMDWCCVNNVHACIFLYLELVLGSRAEDIVKFWRDKASIVR